MEEYTLNVTKYSYPSHFILPPPNYAHRINSKLEFLPRILKNIINYLTIYTLTLTLIKL